MFRFKFTDWKFWCFQKLKMVYINNRLYYICKLVKIFTKRRHSWQYSREGRSATAAAAAANHRSNIYSDLVTVTIILTRGAWPATMYWQRIRVASMKILLSLMTPGNVTCSSMWRTQHYADQGYIWPESSQTFNCNYRASHWTLLHCVGNSLWENG